MQTEALRAMPGFDPSKERLLPRNKRLKITTFNHRRMRGRTVSQVQARRLDQVSLRAMPSQNVISGRVKTTTGFMEGRSGLAWSSHVYSRPKPRSRVTRRRR